MSATAYKLEDGDLAEGPRCDVFKIMDLAVKLLPVEQQWHLWADLDNALIEVHSSEWSAIITEWDRDLWLIVGDGERNSEELWKLLDEQCHKPENGLAIEADIENLEYFQWLDGLRRGGSINMFGAEIPLAEEFSFDKKTARNITKAWMESFDARHPNGDR